MTRTIAVSLAILAAFWIPASFLASDAMTNILRPALFIASAYGIVRWGDAAFRVYFDRAGERSSLGILGIVLTLAGIALASVYSVVFIALERPIWLREMQISNFLTFVTFIGVCLFTVSSRYEGERPTRLSGIAAACIAGFGVLFSSLGPLVISKIVAILSAIAHMGVFIR